MLPSKLSLAVGLSALLAVFAQAAVEVTEQQGKVEVKIGGQPFTQYRYAEATHVFFYPLLGPGGVKMTRDYPMVPDSKNEDHDHLHHRSLWFAHGLVNGVDYWSEIGTYAPGKQPKFPIGKIVQEKLLKAEGGEKEGVISAKLRWESPDGTVPLTSVQTMRIYDRPQNERLFDFEVTLTAGDKEVLFGDTKEGSMAVRIAETMRLAQPKKQPGQGKIVNNDGLKDGDVWGKHAKWVDYYGPVEGKTVGIAIFDNPTNPRYPTRWHARDYGLFAANPFCEHDMDKTQPEGAGDFKLAAGQSVTFRYRFYLHEGDAEAAKVAERFAEWEKSAK